MVLYKKYIKCCKLQKTLHLYECLCALIPDWPLVNNLFLFHNFFILSLLWLAQLQSANCTLKHEVPVLIVAYNKDFIFKKSSVYVSNIFTLQIKSRSCFLRTEGGGTQTARSKKRQRELRKTNGSVATVIVCVFKPKRLPQRIHLCVLLALMYFRERHSSTCWTDINAGHRLEERGHKEMRRQGHKGTRGYKTQEGASLRVRWSARETVRQEEETHWKWQKTSVVSFF